MDEVMDEAMDEVRDVRMEMLKDIEVDTTCVEKMRMEIRKTALALKPQSRQAIFIDGPVPSDSKQACFLRLMALFYVKSEELVMEVSELLNMMANPETELKDIVCSMSYRGELAKHMNVVITEVMHLAYEMLPQCIATLTFKLAVAASGLKYVGRDFDDLLLSITAPGAIIKDHIPKVTDIKEWALHVQAMLRDALKLTKGIMRIKSEVLDLEKRKDSILCSLTLMCVVFGAVHRELKDILLKISNPETVMADLNPHMAEIRPKMTELIDMMLDTIALKELTGFDENEISCPDKRKRVDTMFPMCAEVLELWFDFRNLDTLMNYPGVLVQHVQSLIPSREKACRRLLDAMKREVLTISKIILETVDSENPDGKNDSIIRALTFLRLMNRCLLVEARELENRVVKEEEVSDILITRVMQFGPLVRQTDERTAEQSKRCMSAFNLTAESFQ